MSFSHGYNSPEGDMHSGVSQRAEARNPELNFIDLMREAKHSGENQGGTRGATSAANFHGELNFDHNDPFADLGRHEFGRQDKEQRPSHEHRGDVHRAHRHGRSGEPNDSTENDLPTGANNPPLETAPNAAATDNTPVAATPTSTASLDGAPNTAMPTDNNPVAATSASTASLDGSPNPATPTDNNPVVATPVSTLGGSPNAAADSVPTGGSTAPLETAPTASTPANQLSNFNAPSTYASDAAAVQAINEQPTSEAAMNVGAGNSTPPLPQELSTNLAPVTINGNGDLSALNQYGTLTTNADGSTTFDGNGKQVPPLVLNDVSNLTVKNSVFYGVNGGAVTITGGSDNVSVVGSTFQNIGSGVDVQQANNVEPTNITVSYNNFSNINGPWPEASAVQFAGGGAGATAAVANGHNDISHNTIDDTSTNAALSGQDIISSYNYNDGNNNASTLIYANQITGSYTTSDGSHPPDTASIAELSSNVTIAGNYATNQSNGGFANAGSTNVNIIGNLVTQSISPYNNSAENGINPTGQWMYNNSDQKPIIQQSAANPTGGWPDLYSPAGLTNDPGNTNNWDIA